MVSGSALRLFLLLSPALCTQICPIYSCDSSVASATCAVYVGSNSFKLNANGCPNSYTCSAALISSWAASIFSNGLGSQSSSQECILTPTTSTTTTTTTTFQSLPCLTKVPGKTFQSGQSIVTCQKDDDCLLTDGTKTVCSCTFSTNGLGICNADYSNTQVFAGYWNACGSANAIMDENAALYWTAYMTNWLYEQGTVGCIALFSEVQYDKALFDNYNGAEALAAVVVAWLLW